MDQNAVLLEMNPKSVGKKQKQLTCWVVPRFNFGKNQFMVPNLFARKKKNEKTNLAFKNGDEEKFSMHYYK